ncbi:MAG: hypothetical protein L0Y68_06775 [Candidatus Dadabacteria bacterium]|nr:hypothetical protein [Candidatus Dadabacteria bacterium]
MRKKEMSFLKLYGYPIKACGNDCWMYSHQQDWWATQVVLRKRAGHTCPLQVRETVRRCGCHKQGEARLAPTSDLLHPSIPQDERIFIR